MKIAIIGYSGSGKSTLARALGKYYNAEVLHLDTVHFLPDWVERQVEDEQCIVEEFMDTHDAWVIDGNYGKLSHGRRMNEADHIIMMLLDRFACFRSVWKRFRNYKNDTRPDMAEGCSEKLDLEFATWVLWRGRTKQKRGNYERIREAFPDKVTVLRNRKQADAFLKSLTETGVWPD